MERPVIAIFGAAVLTDGRASPSLRRRIGYGAAAALTWPEAPVLCSGGVGRAGPSEASIMQVDLIGRGVAPGRLRLDEASLDTLQSVVAIARFAGRHGLDGAIVCSDRYHIPRIRLLLAVLGVRTAAGPTAPGLDGTRPSYWLKMHLREALAVPYDLAIVLVRRRGLLAQIRA
ncbi:MAG: YdcF family protein [Caulobacterales bacterium]|jgi:vancomycin permeability regulator SanA